MCAALFGGVGRRWRSEKQLNNQLDCWWKAKGGADERPVTVTNSDESQPPLAFGNDVWKAEENGRVVVCRRHDGGGDMSGEDRGKRGEKRQDRCQRTTTAMPILDAAAMTTIMAMTTTRTTTTTRRTTCRRWPRRLVTA